MTDTAAEYVWLNANSKRARDKLPASAECFVEQNGKGLGGRYVYRVPIADFDPRILGGGYHGKINRARVKQDMLLRCWKE
jgi:hypothetical protein